MLLADAREAFLTSAKSRNLSPRTVTWYGVVGQIAEHVGADKNVATVTAADVRAFLAAYPSNPAHPPSHYHPLATAAATHTTPSGQRGTKAEGPLRGPLGLA